MGSTVTTSRLVRAWRAPDGQTSYACYEASYEKNMYPHVPSWSAFSGTMEYVVRRIFLWASACEGSMLQDPDGHIKPEVYIRRWMSRLANPIPAATIADLDQPPYGGRGRRPRWHEQPHGDVALGRNTPKPSEARQPPRHWPRYMAVSIGNNEPELFRLDADDRLRHVGWRYAVVQSFVGEYADTELNYPGSYFSEIAEFRRHVHEAKQCHGDMIFEIPQIAEGTDGHRFSATRRIIQAVGPYPTLRAVMAHKDARSILYDLTYVQATLAAPRQELALA